MQGPGPIVKTRLKKEMHARFRAEQQARGVSESELLRLALLQFFETARHLPGDTGPVTLESRPTPAACPANDVPQRKTVWMPPLLMKEATARASARGMSFSRWICSLVQSNLTRHPVLTHAELLALEASNRELSATGRNISQIARALDQAYFQTERIGLDRLAELSRQITRTRQAIAALVRASRRSWRSL